MAETKTTKEGGAHVAPSSRPGAIVTTADPRFPTLSPAKQQEVISAELFGNAAKIDCDYTEYGKKCALNAIVAAQVFLRDHGKDFKDIDVQTFVLSLHNVAVTELNCSTVPSEAYCDLRGNVLTIRPQGVGNERLTRKWGVGIKPETGLHKCWVIREGDEFSLPQFDGMDVVPPKWTPKSLHGKAILVVYPVEKKNGDVEWLMADRASVISNVVAQIRSNTLYAFMKTDANGNLLDKYGGLAYPKGKYRPVVDVDKRDAFYETLNKLAEQANGDLDKFLEYPEVRKYINPTYTSFGSREAMIERKMKNNALRPYPKDFESSIVAKAVDAMQEDYDESLDSDRYVDEGKDVVSTVESETKTLPKGEPVPDFSVDSETGEVMAEPAKPEPKPEKKPEKKPEPKKEAPSAGPSYEDLL